MFRTRSAIALAALLALTATACDDDEDVTQPPKPDVFVANLSGSGEIPAVSTPATGVARVEFTATGFTYTLNVTGIPAAAGNITGAHIHSGTATTPSGPVVLNLSPNAAALVNGTGVLASGTATAATTFSGGITTVDSLKALIRNGNAYVNVHTQVNPGGHIRGQLVKQP